MEEKFTARFGQVLLCLKFISKLTNCDFASSVRCFCFCFVFYDVNLMKFFKTEEQKAVKLFSIGAKVLTLHNILIPAAHCVLLLKGRVRPGALG